MQNQNTKPNAELLWKQLDDVLAPHLHLSVVDRAVYFHLVRHSRLEGNRTVRFSILKVARNLYLSHGPVRESVRRLVEQGVLRLIERTKTGHLVEPRLPEEIRSLRGAAMASRLPLGRMGRPSNLEKLNFMKTRPLRQSIHAREGGKCFFCLRRIPVRMKCLDHVIPRVQFGRNSYRNLVSCCMECNSAKKEHSAADYLRSLYRDGRLTAIELNKRLRALNDLAAGKLRPMLPSQGDAGSKKQPK
jgi:HNH endonuclease